MRWARQGLRWSYCAFIAWSSLQTFLAAHAGHDHASHDIVALVLSSVEMLAITAFLFERLEVPACVVLVGVYTVAALLTAFAGQMPIRFVYFAATAIYIVVSRRIKPSAVPSADLC